MKNAILILVLAASACAQQRSDSAPSSSQPAADTPKDPVKTQIAEGARLYGAHCASCHGDAGQGADAPALVGAGALPGTPPEGRKHRTGTFATVADIHTFVDDTMPPGDPSVVSADDAWAILAFDLSANGIELSAPLSTEAAAKIEIPAAGL
jgi:mono/diheme cytochrome c family protein